MLNLKTSTSTLRSQVGARAGWSTACSIPCPGCVTQKRSACHELDTLRPRDTGRAGLVCPFNPLTLASPRTSLRLVTRQNGAAARSIFQFMIQNGTATQGFIQIMTQTGPAA